MCVQCDEVNKNADPVIIAAVKEVLAELDSLEALTAITYLEQGGIPVPKPATVDNDPIKALLSLVDTYPYQVTIAARDAVHDVTEFKLCLEGQLDEIFSVR